LPLPADPITVVLTHYEAIRNRDRTTLLSTLDDHVELVFPGPPTIPFAGVWRGIEGAKRFYTAIRETAEVIEFVVEDMTAEGDSVAVTGRERFLVKATGREWSCNWVQVHVVAAGKIRSYREFSDTAAITAAYAGD
jgi:ketosteroid isomerase-like protein